MKAKWFIQRTYNNNIKLYCLYYYALNEKFKFIAFINGLLGLIQTTNMYNALLTGFLKMQVKPKPREFQ